MQCGVCDSAASKYKCPTCRLPYCSLLCFKNHRAAPCSRPEEANDASKLGQQQQPRRDFEGLEDDSGSRLRRRQLEAVAASEEIRGMITDEELQQIVSKIDASERAEEDLDVAMNVPAFKEFADKLLAIIAENK